jgi:anthranilate/para-aminobenzoate synthase component II
MGPRPPGEAILFAVRVLLIDNYDSFTYNLVQRIGELDPSVDLQVVRNDMITVEQARALGPTHLLISPGPCTPKDTGNCPDLIRAFQGRIPILGVCLGHQTKIRHDGRGIFEGLPDPFTATRYHSLIVDRATIGDEFEVSAWTDQDEVMGLRWAGGDPGAAPMDGVQFHPESFLTVNGPDLLANFLDLPRPAKNT